jgi:hypothetical protein
MVTSTVILSLLTTVIGYVAPVVASVVLTFTHAGHSTVRQKDTGVPGHTVLY